MRFIIYTNAEIEEVWDECDFLFGGVDKVTKRRAGGYMVVVNTDVVSRDTMRALAHYEEHGELATNSGWILKKVRDPTKK